MMENQHRKIKGYRELEDFEIEAMNNVKSIGNALSVLIEHLENLDSTDKRWLAKGKTDLQVGIMSVVRSIAKPTTF